MELAFSNSPMKPNKRYHPFRSTHCSRTIWPTCVPKAMHMFCKYPPRTIILFGFVKYFYLQSPKLQQNFAINYHELRSLGQSFCVDLEKHK